MRPIKAGFVGFGEVNTPKHIIAEKCTKAQKLIESQGIDLIVTAPVTDDPEGKDVARARAELSQKDFDLLIICIAGWIPSHAVIGVIDAFRHKPMILWGLTGWYEGERFITTADQAGTTALRKPMQDLGFTFKYVVTLRGKNPNPEEITSYAQAARAAALLRNAKIGMMGYRDMKLYGTLHEGVSLRAKIGPEVEIFDMLEMQQVMDKLPAHEIQRVVATIKKNWKFTKQPKLGTIEKTVKLYLAVSSKIKETGYEAVSLIDVDGVKKLLKFAPAGVFMLLHERDNVCTIPENDVMGSVTQLVTRYLTGQVGAYLEFYEFMERGMLMGVPDYVPSEIVDGPVRVMPTAFGEFGEGLLNVSKIKPGKVTMARLSYTGDRYSLHMITGDGRRPRKWEEAGWTPPAPQLPALEITVTSPIDEFIQKVSGQHYILSYGDNTGIFRDLCSILKIEIL